MSFPSSSHVAASLEDLDVTRFQRSSSLILVYRLTFTLWALLAWCLISQRAGITHSLTFYNGSSTSLLASCYLLFFGFAPCLAKVDVRNAQSRGTTVDLNHKLPSGLSLGSPGPGGDFRWICTDCGISGKLNVILSHSGVEIRPVDTIDIVGQVKAIAIPDGTHKEFKKEFDLIPDSASSVGSGDIKIRGTSKFGFELGATGFIPGIQYGFNATIDNDAIFSIGFQDLEPNVQGWTPDFHPVPLKPDVSAGVSAEIYIKHGVYVEFEAFGQDWIVYFGLKSPAFKVKTEIPIAQDACPAAALANGMGNGPAGVKGSIVASGGLEVEIKKGKKGGSDDKKPDNKKPDDDPDTKHHHHNPNDPDTDPDDPHTDPDDPNPNDLIEAVKDGKNLWDKWGKFLLGDDNDDPDDDRRRKSGTKTKKSYAWRNYLLPDRKRQSQNPLDDYEHQVFAKRDLNVYELPLFETCYPLGAEPTQTSAEPVTEAPGWEPEGIPQTPDVTPGIVPGIPGPQDPSAIWPFPTPTIVETQGLPQVWQYGSQLWAYTPPAVETQAIPGIPQGWTVVPPAVETQAPQGLPQVWQVGSQFFTIVPPATVETQAPQQVWPIPAPSTVGTQAPQGFSQIWPMMTLATVATQAPPGPPIVTPAIVPGTQEPQGLPTVGSLVFHHGPRVSFAPKD
ncbi:hypothetical protein M011DRAFT_526999 [Sporormia fimetaria CBS 119925]|uniref:Uncharacterized protein n=1 Tax=Sporormia fimetaria CBS 119925 TaxID=1340428 RepID=A0A6A6V929_9PLEO|nr:hypothetical protein M011DRAFT_526999 [Sporormia fimetaria CBS 119925]